LADHRYPEIELHKVDNSHGSGTSRHTMYKIEVRSSYPEPTTIDGFIIDFVWRTLPIVEGRSPWGMNIPVSFLDNRGIEHGLVGYTAAQAHRWGFLAALGAKRISGALCIETRLVQVELNYSYTITEKGVSDKLDSEGFLRNKTEFKPRNPDFIVNIMSAKP
jgi:hypothetical protein